MLTPSQIGFDRFQLDLMITTLLILSTCTPCQVSTSPAVSTATVATIVQSRSFEERFEAAGEDVEDLWSLYLWCDAGGRTREGKVVLRKIVEVDPNHNEANTALGHVEYRGRWFRNQRKLDQFKKKQEEAEAMERGLVLFKDEWVSKHDLPFLKRGLVRGPDGGWVTKEERGLLEKGWVRQDLQWIEPTEADKIDQGLWKCGDQWLPLEKADRYHSRIGQWWKFTSSRFVIYSTLNREQAIAAGDEIDLTYDDLVRAYGHAPEATPTVIILRNQTQYTRLAKTGRDGDRTDGLGVSTIHHAYLADEGFDVEAKSFWGAGVAFWDTNSESGNSFGRLAARHAAGQAFAQAIDPSPKAVEKAAKKPQRGMDLGAFYDEKLVPTWYRYGAAAYVERYFVDSLVASDGDPHWAKAWSVENLRKRGGLMPLSMFFGRKLDTTDEQAAARWINQCGLIMAFILDGGVEPVQKAHQQLTAAIKKRKRTDKLQIALETVLQEHESELKSFMRKP